MQFGRHKTVGLNIKSLPKDISKNVLKLFQGGISNYPLSSKNYADFSEEICFKKDDVKN